MKKLLEGVVVISFIIITTKGIAPEILGHAWVHRPALAVFGASVPIAFALSFREYSLGTNGKALAGCLAYLFLFSVVIGLVVAGAGASKAAHHSIQAMERRHPPQLFNALVDASDSGQRRTAAKIIYTEFGGKVPYRAENQTYRVFDPTSKERTNWLETKEMHQSMDLSNHRLLTASMQSMLAGVYLVSAFFVLFSITLILGHLSLTNRSSRRS